MTFRLWLSLFLFCLATGVTAQKDLYDHLLEANRAQIVMLQEQKLLVSDLARDLAFALDEIEAEATSSAERSANYLDLEAKLIAKLGPSATNIHLGRSRNDLGAAMNRMALRDRVLELLAALAAAREQVLALAAEHQTTVVPGFTHAVQAQPTTLGHILLAFDSHLARDRQRFEEAFRRLNQSPLGVAAITNSGFAMDRDRLAQLLGFDGLVDNAYDAIVISTADSKLELTQAASLAAIATGRFAQDVLFQYDDPAPGLVLSVDTSGRSSIMPQKRNPGLVERLRVAASEVVGDATTAQFYAHNTPMHEVRDTRAPLYDKTDEVLRGTIDIFQRLRILLESLEVRVERLRQRVDQDYSTMTELADVLHREAQVPFRKGYAFASALTTYGRAEGKTPNELTWEEARSVYRDLHQEALPISAEVFSRAIDPVAMINARLGTGGPQPKEISRMLVLARDDLALQRRFIAEQRRDLDKASALLAKRIQRIKRD